MLTAHICAAHHLAGLRLTNCFMHAFLCESVVHGAPLDEAFDGEVAEGFDITMRCPKLARVPCLDDFPKA